MEFFLALRRSGYVLTMTVVNMLLAMVPTNTLRVVIARCMGARLGHRVTLERGVRIDFPWRLTIGNNCYISRHVYLDCRGGQITVGDDSDISEGALIYTLSHDIRSPELAPKKGNVLIGNRCWICARAIVLPGAHIGVASVLSANSVFSGEASEYSLLIGNPAQRTKSLDPIRATRVRQ